MTLPNSPTSNNKPPNPLTLDKKMFRQVYRPAAQLRRWLFLPDRTVRTRLR